ncbi:MAG: TlpA disulfide reductase family protein [Polyangiales bacterium]
MSAEGTAGYRDPPNASAGRDLAAERSWLRRVPSASAAALVFLACAIAAGVSFGLAALDGERRRDAQLVAILRPEYTGSDRTAPDFTLNDHRGRPFRLSSLRGKTVVLHFWSRDCPPCIQELSESLPAFDELIRGRTDIALVLVGVERWEEVSALVPRDFRSPLLFDPERAVVLNRYGTRLFPETWIIDPEGVIRARFDRTLDWAAPAFLQYALSLR